MRRGLLGAALPLIVCAAPALAAPSQAELDRLAAQLGFRFTIVDNRAECSPGTPGCFVSEIEITTPAELPQALRQGIEIRYSYVSRMVSVDSDMFDGKLINGDLNLLTLKPGKALAPAMTYRIRLLGSGHFFSAAYAMPNAQISAPGLQSRVIAATRPGKDPETGLETLPFLTPLTDEAKLSIATAEDRTRWLTPERAFARYAERGAGTLPDVAILPRPLKVSRPAGAPLDLSGGVTLSLDGVPQDELAAALHQLGGALDRGPALRIAIRSGISSESYRLDADAKGIRIEAADAAGASYAIRSLAQQAAFEAGHLRPITIEDAPRYSFRGMHLDVARNFHSKTEILKLVEAMASFKLNKLHLHLADDEGWRLEVKALPELAEIGGFRCGDASEKTCIQPQLGAAPERDAPTNGYLTQANYLEILAAARARQIEVIPSLDMPGHSRAAIRAMEVRYERLVAAGKRDEAEQIRLTEPGDTTRYRSIQNYDDNTLNVCLDSTYRVIDTVVGELAALHQQAGTPLKTYHIGADETAGAWTQSPACQAMMAKTGIKPEKLGAHFIERVAQSLAARGVTPAGWSDGMGHTDTAKMPQAVQSNIWGGLYTGGVAEAHNQLNRGWRIVLSMPDYAYLDMPNAPGPQEPGYDWAAREVDTFKIFSWMPDNLPANAAVSLDIQSKPATLEDKTPVQPGRHISGLQGQLWSETIRTDVGVEYMIFPRLLALAERAWRRAAWEPAYQPGATYAYGDARVDRAALLADWRDFAGRAGTALGVLDRQGVAYRLAAPGARIVDGKLEATPEFPQLRIEYRVGEGAWQAWTKPVAVSGDVTVRTRSPDGKRAGRSAKLGTSMLK